MTNATLGLLLYAASSAPVRIFASALIALTGADWTALVTTVLGSSALATISGLVVGLRRNRAEALAQRIAGSAQMKTVAAEEAESATRVLGGVVDRLDDRLTKCETRWTTHERVCPLLRKGRHD
jgi:hypothetical protein